MNKLGTMLGKTDNQKPVAGSKAGVEKAFPILFWAMASLGFILPRRHSSGHYQTQWRSLIPMTGIIAIACGYISTYSLKFTSNAYDVLVDAIAYSVCFLFIGFSFAIAIYRRREVCKLLEGLDGRLTPSKAWVSISSSFLFFLDISVFFSVYFVIAVRESVPYSHWVVMTSFYPVLPLALDLLVMHFIRSLNEVYEETLERIRGSDSRKGQDLPCHPLRYQFHSSICSPVKSPIDISAVMGECSSIAHLVDLHNQVFSSWTLVRCGAFMAKLLDAAYYVTIHFGNWPSFASCLFYGVNEVVSFYGLCRQADLLAEKHRKMEDVLLSLQQESSTSSRDHLRLLSLSFQLKSRPPRIAVGNVADLSSNVLVTMVNVSITFFAIIYQYRP